jgi:hypothetical protein
LLPLLREGFRYLKRTVWLAGGGHAGGSGTTGPAAPHASLAGRNGLSGGAGRLLRASCWRKIGSPRHRLRCRHGADGDAAGGNWFPTRPTTAGGRHAVAGPYAVAAQRNSGVGLNWHLEAGKADPAAVAKEGEHLNRLGLRRDGCLCPQERPQGGGCRAVPNSGRSDSMHGRGLGAGSRRDGTGLPGRPSEENIGRTGTVYFPFRRDLPSWHNRQGAYGHRGNSAGGCGPFVGGRWLGGGGRLQS